MCGLSRALPAALGSQKGKKRGGGEGVGGGRGGEGGRPYSQPHCGPKSLVPRGGPPHAVTLVSRLCRSCRNGVNGGSPISRGGQISRRTTLRPGVGRRAPPAQKSAAGATGSQVRTQLAPGKGGETRRRPSQLPAPVIVRDCAPAQQEVPAAEHMPATDAGRGDGVQAPRPSRAAPGDCVCAPVPSAPSRGSAKIRAKFQLITYNMWI